VTYGGSARHDSDGRFAYHVWPDGCAVFDRLSGNTHLLDVFSAWQFLSIPGTPSSIREVLKLPELLPDQLTSAFEDARERLAKLQLPYSAQ
jgi:hypothetical protein